MHENPPFLSLQNTLIGIKCWCSSDPNRANYPHIYERPLLFTLYPHISVQGTAMLMNVARCNFSQHSESCKYLKVCVSFDYAAVVDLCVLCCSLCSVHLHSCVSFLCPVMPSF